jgi:hypothetical protein
MHKVMSSPTAANYRIAKYYTFRNPKKVLYLQKHFLNMKLESQIQLLKSLHRPEVQEAIDGLAAWQAKIVSAKDKRDLLTIEARAGHLYFRNYAKIFDKRYGFVSCNGGGIRTVNRGEVCSFIRSCGMWPRNGFTNSKSIIRFKRCSYQVLAFHARAIAIITHFGPS